MKAADIAVRVPSVDEDLPAREAATLLARQDLPGALGVRMHVRG